MAKNAVGDWDSTAANNTDVGGINIAENCAAAGINNALREIMAQISDLNPVGAGATVTISGEWTVLGELDLENATVTLPDDVVVTAKIGDGAVTLAKIDGSILTGADSKLVTGTAGNDGYLAYWNSDGDLIGGDFVRTQGSWNLGTNEMESTITPAKLTARLTAWLASREFTSTAQSIPSGGVVSVAHGLEATPKELECWIVCTTTDLGYSVGDVVALGGSRDGDGARNFTLYANSTNILFSRDASGLYIGDQSSSYEGAAITPARWSLYLRGRL